MKQTDASNPLTEEPFRTLVPLPAPLRRLEVGERLVFLGSCFAEHIGRAFREACLPVVANPLGPLYAPASIVHTMDARRIDDAAQAYGRWHTWLSDTTFSRPTREACLRDTQQALDGLREALAEADHLFLTLGTPRAYRLRQTGQVVANCHKHPQSEFEEIRPGVAGIVEGLDGALCRLRERNPRAVVTFTVSPFRYAKYGFVESQRAKARLLLAVEALQERHPQWVQYFPAYELVMDELRDYRFYADDMLHPSPQAVGYIARRLQEWMTPALRDYLRRWQPLGQALAHRPLHPEGEAWEAFRQSTNRKLEHLQRDYPMLHIPDRL